MAQALAGFKGLRLGAWELGAEFLFYPLLLTFPMFLLLYESSRFINTLWIRIAFSVVAEAASSSAMVGASLVAKEKESPWLPGRWGRGPNIAGPSRLCGGGAWGSGRDSPGPGAGPKGSSARRAFSARLQGQPHSAQLLAGCLLAGRALYSLAFLLFENPGNTSQWPLDRED